MNAPILFYIAMSATDLYQTMIGLGRGFQEENPIMEQLVYSPVLFIAAKIVLTLFVSLAVWVSWKKMPEGRWLPQLALLVVIVLQTLAVVSNALLLSGLI